MKTTDVCQNENIRISSKYLKIVPRYIYLRTARKEVFAGFSS